jgi:hypothetical protein
MQDDNLYVNDGDQYTNGVYYPPEATVVKEAEQKQKSVQSTSYPIMNDVADWFNEQIAICDSATFIKSYAKENNISMDEAHAGFEVARTLLESKAVEFAEFGSSEE